MLTLYHQELKKNKLGPKLEETRIRKKKEEQMQSRPEKYIEKSTEKFLIFFKSCFFFFFFKDKVDKILAGLRLHRRTVQKRSS